MSISRDQLYQAINSCLKPVKENLNEVDTRVRQIIVQLDSIESRVKVLQKQLTSIEKSVEE